VAAEETETLAESVTPEAAGVFDLLDDTVSAFE
jgi:hypothetical protein